ncbi:MAG: hypothetical protein FWG09_00740 [Synergistaceae bacterium]|nr:hypothetical protein [Synergistaceae bacterium]
MEKTKAEVLRYLGRRGQEVPEELDGLIEGCIALMREAASFRQAHLSFPVSRAEDGLFLLTGAGIPLRGKDIASHLSGCTQAVLLAVTLGAGADALIRKWERADLTRSLVLDACATQLIEEFCDEIERQICAEAAASGLVSVPRFSPGYGDFPLDIQPRIIEALNAGRAIGLTCTEHHILLPRKSVTALIGLSAQREASVPQPVSKCDGCSKSDTCISVSKSSVDEAAFVTRREGVDRPTSSKGSKNNEVYG